MIPAQDHRKIRRLRDLIGYIEKSKRLYIFYVKTFLLICTETPAIMSILGRLDVLDFEWDFSWKAIEWPIGEEEEAAYRWSAVVNFAKAREADEANALLLNIGEDSLCEARKVFVNEILIPLYDYIASVSSEM